MIGQNRKQTPKIDMTILREIDAIFAELELLKDGNYGHIMDFRQRNLIEEMVDNYEKIKKKYDINFGE